MRKIVIKTALITLGTVIALLALAFGIASLAFPQNMSVICENCGNYPLAASYASRQYDYSGSTDDLYRCADLYIRTGDRANTLKYCKKLCESENFETYCAQKDGEGEATHAQYIYKNYALALYLSGKGDEAVEIAEASRKFGYGTYLTLTLEAIKKEDKEFGEKLLTSIRKEQDDGQLYTSIVNQLEKLTGDNI